MILTTSQEITKVMGGVDIFSLKGILILIIEILFTFGLLLLMIL